MRNPLIPDILAFLRDHPEGIEEYDLLKALKAKHPMLSKLAEDQNLLLFRQHFLIMNALYQLKNSLWVEEQITLNITGMRVNLQYAPPEATSDCTTLSDSHDAKLGAYYMDWDEYVNTDKDAVEQLLQSFYNGIATIDERKDALKTLALHVDFIDDKDAIKRQYRKLARDAHPDRGGDPERFISLRQAYECLMHALI
ncbi:DNA-J related domain-containing protein [Marinomonas fungiae]|uniref:DNA-J related protein/DnaJ domain n=1 Tax=Marinomonas fungiae TaxID=1137284 RepID=A0A0K6INI9_9GAMM|nr:DNA-J related domain-containing protein [Marinomonas fungiae]CUB04651.1 DNA-J related protein/DnaJ domain [Marinomonas fungiae]